MFYKAIASVMGGDFIVDSAGFDDRLDCLHVVSQESPVNVVYMLFSEELLFSFILCFTFWSNFCTRQ